VIQGPIGCLSADTEVLTRRGWVRIDQWAGLPILTWSEDGSARYADPLAYANLPCDEFWHFSNERALSMVVSDEHRMPLVDDRSGRFKVRTAGDVAHRVGRNTVPSTFRVDGIGADSRVLRLHVAIAADGCLPKRGNQVVFGLRKERKKERLRQLLTALGIRWKEFQHSTRPTETSFAFQRESWMTKDLAMWHLGTDALAVVLDEVRHWDGLFSGPDTRFDSTSRAAADFVQYAAHACGGLATIAVKTDARGKDWSPMFSVNIALPGSAKAKVGLRGDNVDITRVRSADGRKYCFTTETGFFVARHDGRVFVTGNSGTSTACCHKIRAIGLEQEPDIDGVRRTRWIVFRNTYRELRETTVKTWLHWFREEHWGEFVRSEPMRHTLVGKHPAKDGTSFETDVIFIAINDPVQAEQIAASFEITGFFGNEVQFQEKSVIDELLSRCGRYPSKSHGPGATWHGGFLDLNAPTEGHWIPYMRGDVPMPPEWTQEMKDLHAIPREDSGEPAWKFFVQPAGLREIKIEGKLTYATNPEAENTSHLAKSYLEQIRSKPKEWIDARVMNRVTLHMHGKPVYPTFSVGENMNDRDMPPIDGLPIIVGLDFGRDPAAVAAQAPNGEWLVLDELIGENESAVTFAPRVSRWLSHFQGFTFEFWGDPRGGDLGQVDDNTAFEVFARHGMPVWPASTDNNKALRREAVNAVLNRRNGLRVNPRCRVLKTGMAGGYHYRKIAGSAGLFSPRPVKNGFSHVVEGLENALLGGGEGDMAVRGNVARQSKVVQMPRKSLRLR
jgi:hypothetical protein